MTLSDPEHIPTRNPSDDSRVCGALDSSSISLAMQMSLRLLLMYNTVSAYDSLEKYSVDARHDGLLRASLQVLG